MALANKRAQNNKETQSSPFYAEKGSEEDSSYQSIGSPLDLFSYKDIHQPSLLDEEEESGSSHSLRAYYSGFAPTQYDSSNSSYNNFVSGANSSSAIQEANSWMGSKSSLLDNWAYSSSSVLSFDRAEECANWVSAVDQNFAMNANSSSIEDSNEGVEKERASQKRAHMVLVHLNTFLSSFLLLHIRSVLFPINLPYYSSLILKYKYSHIILLFNYNFSCFLGDAQRLFSSH